LFPIFCLPDFCKSRNGNRGFSFKTKETGKTTLSEMDPTAAKKKFPHPAKKLLARNLQ
jgi:hypothetical protein